MNDNNHATMNEVLCQSCLHNGVCKYTDTMSLVIEGTPIYLADCDGYLDVSLLYNEEENTGEDIEEGCEDCPNRILCKEYNNNNENITEEDNAKSIEELVNHMVSTLLSLIPNKTGGR